MLDFSAVMQLEAEHRFGKEKRMAKASFSRKPQVSGIKIAGTITRKGGGVVTDEEADQLLSLIVLAIDGTSFEAETLTAIVK
jgi:hypothetical protein